MHQLVVTPLLVHRSAEYRRQQFKRESYSFDNLKSSQRNIQPYAGIHKSNQPYHRRSNPNLLDILPPPPLYAPEEEELLTRNLQNPYIRKDIHQRDCSQSRNLSESKRLSQSKQSINEVMKVRYFRGSLDESDVSSSANTTQSDQIHSNPARLDNKDYKRRRSRQRLELDKELQKELLNFNDIVTTFSDSAM